MRTDMSDNKNRLRTLVAQAAVLVGMGDVVTRAAAEKPEKPRWKQLITGVDRFERATRVADQPVALEKKAEREMKWESVAALTIGKPPRAPRA